jgi:intein/homing endonuclease
MPLWSDLYRIYKHAFKADPISELGAWKEPEGASQLQPELVPAFGSDGFWSGGKGTLRVNNDFIDLSSVTNRQSRYKEYDRLQSVAEVDMALTVFADETCVAGDTEVSTPFGPVRIADLAAEKKPGDRFLVYCFDFSKQDWTLGWAHSPRQTKTAETVKIVLDDGTTFVCTPDHRVLRRDGTWVHAGDLTVGCEMMAFHRLRARGHLRGMKTNQFPRIFTYRDGWKHERQFIDEWRIGKSLPKYEKISKLCRMLSAGLGRHEIPKLVDLGWKTCEYHLHRNGFSYGELKYLRTNYQDSFRVVGVIPNGVVPVYDLTVDTHENFASTNVCFHNCQVGENGHMFEIKAKDSAVKTEAEFLLYDMLEIEDELWSDCRNLFLYGDQFYELIIHPDDPKGGIVKIQRPPADSMFRIETTKGKLLEFQQSKDAPDYNSLARVDITRATQADLIAATALRFAPEQIIHMRIGDSRKTFYPYGISLVDVARGPAHQLRLTEDSMVVYRLCLSGKEKVRMASDSPGGTKQMKDIRAGDLVYTYVPGEGLVATKVKWAGMTGVKPVFDVRSKTMSVTATSNHPFFVHNKIENVDGYIPVSNLDPNVHQLIRVERVGGEPKKIDRFYGPVYGRLTTAQKKLWKCTKGMGVTKKERMRAILAAHGPDFTNSNGYSFFCSEAGYKLPANLAQDLADEFDLGPVTLLNEGEKEPERINLPEYVDEEFASLMGFLIGDGCINYHKTCGKLMFTTGLIEGLNCKYSDLLKKYFGRASFRQDKRCRNGIGEYVVNSYAACRIMENMGLKGNCHTKRVPEWMFNERPEIRKAFIHGLCDADGCKRDMTKKTWCCYIRLTNKSLIEDIKTLWESLGLYASRIDMVPGGRNLVIRGKKTIQNPSWGVRLIDKPLPRYEDIVEIKPAGEEPVYDLEVDHPEHNFIVNDTIVHNSRAPERRVFYVDVGQLPSNKIEAFMERVKDQYRKRKVHSNRGAGASSVDERYHAPAPDEDIYFPIRPNTNSRIETLPGAANLGEVDDALYFRNKLFTALKFPKNYANSDDPQQTRMTLSAQDVRFARLIERLQKSITRGLKQIVTRHLLLRGFPDERYADLQIRMTPPSDWREISRNEVTQARYDRAAAVKGSQLMSDYDILVDILKFDKDRAKEYVARMKQQKLEDLKLQVMGANPRLLGLGQPPDGEKEVGVDATGPNPQLSPADQAGAEGGPPEAPETPEAEGPKGAAPKPEPAGLPEQSEEDVKKYGLELRTYDREIDTEEVDSAELGEAVIAR